LGTKDFWRRDEGPFHFLGRAKKNGTQNKTCGVLRVCLGISQSQRRSPGTTGEQPFRNSEMLTHGFKIPHEMIGRIAVAGKVGMAPPGAALVDQKYVIACRIE